MPTFSQSQAQLLSSGGLDNIGSSKYEYEDVSLNAIASTLVAVAAEFQQDAVSNLQKADRIATGHLEDSIHFENIKVAGSKLSIDIKVAEYYKYVDKGVKGWAGTGGDGTFQFKKPSGHSGQKTSEMVTAIRKWLIREGLKQRNNKYKPISKRERKRAKKSFTDTSTSTAIVVAAAIKRRGLKKTNFWGKAVKDMQKDIAKKFGKASKIDIIESIKNEYSS